MRTPSMPHAVLKRQVSPEIESLRSGHKTEEQMISTVMGKNSIARTIHERRDDAEMQQLSVSHTASHHTTP